MYNATSSKGNIMGNTEQAPSKRVRIVLCAAAFALAAAVTGHRPRRGLDVRQGQADRRLDVRKDHADRRLGKTSPPQLTSKLKQRRLDVGEDQAQRRLDVAREAERRLVELDR